MSPLITAAVGGFVRWAVTFAAAREVTLSADQASQMAYGLVALGTLGWSLWQKHQAEKRAHRP